MSYPLFTDSELDNLFRRVAKQMEIHSATQTGWSDQGFQSLASKGVLTCGLSEKAIESKIPAHNITSSLTTNPQAPPIPEEQSNDFSTSTLTN